MKKILISVIMLCMMSALLFVAGPAVSADSYTAPTQQTSAPSGYTGIYTVNDLNRIANNPNVSYILMADLDLKNVSFTPIGTDSKPFGGVFDGNGHTISNVSITASGSLGSSYIGLFGCSNGTIKNLVVTNMTIDASLTNGKLYVGAVAGLNEGTISNCKVTADVSGKVSTSVSTKDVNVFAGGIAGENSSTSSSAIYGSIKNCEFYGSVTAEASVPETSPYGYVYAGGITGQNSARNTAVSCCSNYGSVTVTAGNYGFAGGIAGEQFQGSTSYCVNVGAIKAGGGNVMSGGITGSNNMGGDVFCCCNRGTVAASSEYRTFQDSHDKTQTFGRISVGGVLGENDHATMRMTYSRGKISYTKNGDVTVECGGTYGVSYGGAISDCYYLNSSVTVTGSGSHVDKAITESEFANPATFTNFDFIDAWEMSTSGYPTLTMRSAHSHTPTEWTVKLAPTCTESGREVIVCTGCNEVLEARDIPALGHENGEWRTIEPTCTESGKTYTVCTRCGAETESTEIPPKGHVPGDPVVVEASCHKEGSRTIYCTVCGEILEQTSYPMIEHTAGGWTVSEEPTCTHEGTRERRCEICGELLATEKIAPNGHTPGEWTVVKAATCTDDGSRTRVCTVCGETFTQKILATGHTAGEWTVTLEPTCQRTGTEVRSCTVCGEPLDTKTVPMTDHSYVAGVCEYCGEREPAATEAPSTGTASSDTQGQNPSDTDKQNGTDGGDGGSKSPTTVILIIVIAVIVVGGAALLIFITSKKK